MFDAKKQVEMSFKTVISPMDSSMAFRLDQVLNFSRRKKMPTRCELSSLNGSINTSRGVIGECSWAAETKHENFVVSS